jgi:hypothetical protein
MDIDFRNNSIFPWSEGIALKIVRRMRLDTINVYPESISVVQKGGVNVSSFTRRKLRMLLK